MKKKKKIHGVLEGQLNIPGMSGWKISPEISRESTQLDILLIKWMRLLIKGIVNPNIIKLIPILLIVNYTTECKI